MTKLIVAIELYGAVYHDETGVDLGGKEVMEAIQANSHKVVICSGGTYKDVEGNDADYIISNKALGSPKTSDGQLDWGVARVILENDGIIVSKKAEDILENLPISRVKYNTNEE